MIDLLIEQIIEELANGNSNTLNELLVNELTDKQIINRLDNTRQQELENRKPDFELKGGMFIRAKVDLRGVSNSYNTPERIDIPKGTIFSLPSEGTNRGDVFCKLVEGECTKTLRGHNEGQIRVITPDNSKFDVVGLSEGVKTRYPYDLGLADKTCWEIVTQ
jgi:hypothetical protein